MKFVISSSELLNHLNSISRVINAKNTVAALDNYLFQLTENQLKITASDLESTMITTLALENAEGEGSIAIPARILNNTLKEFPEQPLTFKINDETFNIDLFSENGKYSIMGQTGEEYPENRKLNEETSSSITVDKEVLLNGISKTLFATADDELRPVMNGILLEFGQENLTFVASDAHKLVRYKNKTIKTEIESSFILPKKPASLLKGLLPKEDNDIEIRFDEKSAVFTLANYTLICRLVEGTYPKYNSVIPTNNTNEMIVDRLDLFNSVKRVSVFANQASNLIKLGLENNQLVISAQDVDFSISAIERIKCQYENEKIEIGFKSVFLMEILSNINSADVKVMLADSTRAGLFVPLEKENDDEEVLMLLMPMMINA